MNIFNKKYLQLIDENLPAFYFVPGENNGVYPNSHSLLILQNKRNNNAVLIDTGIGHELIKSLLQDFKITKVFLSHWHEDHISGNYFLKKQLTEFYCHSLDAPMVKDIGKFQEFYYTQGSSVEDFFQDLLVTMKIEDLAECREINDSQVIKIDDVMSIKVIHTPGHSAGHCCFYESTNQVIFLADIDLSGLGPWYGCLDSDIDDFEMSIEKLISMDLEYAISSHKGVFVGKIEIRDHLRRFLAVISKRENRILTELSEVKGKFAKELVGKGIIYKNYSSMRDYLFIAEKQMISKHFTRLVKKGKVFKDRDGFLLN